MSSAGDTRAGSPYQEGSEPEAAAVTRKQAKAPLPRRPAGARNVGVVSVPFAACTD